MKPVDLNLRIDGPDWAALAGADRLCQQAADAALAAAGVRNGGALDLLLTDDAEIRALNGRWRGKDAPTDVLAFAADPLDRPFLGDIVIAHGRAAADAAQMARPLTDHLAHLVVHGVLHLLGHDHMEDEEAEKMEALERKALASLGIADPYVWEPR